MPPPGRAAHLRRARRARRPRCARGCSALGLEQGRPVGIWAPNCAEWVLVQYATAKVGVILVNINPAYRTSELEYVLRQSGCRVLVAAPRVQDLRLRARWSRRCARDCPTLEHVVFLDAPDVGRAAGRRRRRTRRAARASCDFDDPINIQYTSGTTGFPKGATLTHHNILNNGFFVGEGCGYTEQDRVCIPVPFYHCFGMVMGNLGCTTHGACMVIPAPAFEPRGDARGGRRRSAARRSTACRRCSSPSSSTRTSTRYDLSLAAHRDHGRLAVPDRGHAQGHRPHAHGRGDDLLRHDRDLAGVDPDARRRPARAPRRHRRPRAPARRGQDRRPGDRAHRGARRAGRAVHARLLRDARLLGRPGAHRRGDRRGALDAHRRPRDDGRARAT